MARRPSRVGCRPVVSVSGKVVRPANDSGVVEDETEGNRVAVGVAECVEYAFAVEVLAISDEEVRPATGAEDGEDVEEFGGERRVELGNGQVELGDVGATLLLALAVLTWTRLACP